MGQPVPFARVYGDAIWDSECLTPTQRIVALCYADHARGGDVAWVSTSRLMSRTGIPSRTTACATVAALVAAGWLEKVGPHPKHRQRIVYRLTVPAVEVEPSRPASKRLRNASGKFETGPAGGPVTNETGPQSGPVHRWDRSTDGTQTGPARGPQPVQRMDETGPQAGPDSLSDSLSDSSSDSPPSRIPALVELGATEDEEEIIIRRVTAANPSIGSIGRYLAAMHTNGDLAPLLDRVRAERRESAARDAVAAAKRAARRLPACEHGVPGGAIVRHPVSGGMLCPLCLLPHDGGGQPETPEGGGGQPETVAPARAVGRAKVPAPNVLEVPRTRHPTGRCPKPGHGAMPGGLRLDGSPHCVCCRAEARAEARAASAAARNTGTDGGRHRADDDPGDDWNLPTGVIKLADYRPAATRIA